MDAPLVCQLSATAPLGSHVRTGEPLKASKRESLPKTSIPTRDEVRPPADDRVDRRQVDRG